MSSLLLQTRAIDQSILTALMLSPERNRSNIGALSALAWDILISMDEEINFIWLTQWTPLKLIYFFTRYYAIIILIVLNSQSLTSSQWIILEGVSAVLLEISTQVILILRIRAMYEGSRRLVHALLAALTLQAIVMVVSVGISIPKILHSPKFAPVIPTEMIAYSVASILYETLLFALVIQKHLRAGKEAHHLGSDTLLTVLVRDSIWAFVAIFVVMVVNTFLFTLAPGTLGAFGFPWILAILGSVGPRLVLNVRVEHARVIRDSHSILTSDMNLTTGPVVFQSASALTHTSSYPNSRINSCQSPGFSPPAGDVININDDDNMYIPYTGPKLWIKPGASSTSADVPRRQKTLPPLPDTECSDESDGLDYGHRVDEETGLMLSVNDEEDHFQPVQPTHNANVESRDGLVEDETQLAERQWLIEPERIEDRSWR